MMLDWLQDLDPKRENLDPQSREILTRLLNEIEAIYKENQELRAENQRLRDETAQLKGHKGKPNIKPNRSPKSATNSEKGKGQENRKILKLLQSQKLVISAGKIARLLTQQYLTDTPVLEPARSQSATAVEKCHYFGSQQLNSVSNI